LRRTRAVRTEAGSQKPPPVIFLLHWGKKAGRKRSDSALLDAFQPLGLEVLLLLFQPTCLSASS